MRPLFAAIALLLTPPAFAQDKDDFSDDDDEIEIEEEAPPAPPPAPKEEPKKKAAPAPAQPPPPPPPPKKGPDEEDLLEDEEDLQFSDEVDEAGQAVEQDMLDDDASARERLRAPGTDDAETYRAEQARLAALPPDEEIMGWEAYLELYPNTLFRDRIDARTDALEGAAYRTRISRGGPGSSADDAELLFVLPMHLPNINPRSKAQVSLDVGFPGSFRGIADFEWALLRNVSVHGGFAGTYDGWGLEIGTRYAFVKSAKSKVVASLIADLRLGFTPLVFQFRPQLAVGKIWDLGKDGLHVQLLVTAGARIGTLPPGTAEGTSFVSQIGVLGGLHLGVRIAPPVGVFVESDFDLKSLDRAGGLFAFQSVSVGMRFFPKLKRRNDSPLQIDVAGHVAAASKYTQHYLGAVQAQGAYFLEPKWLGRKASKK